MESLQKVTKEELECAIKAAENCYRRRIRIHKNKTIDELTGKVYEGAEALKYALLERFGKMEIKVY